VNLSSILGSLTLHADPKSPIYGFKALAYDASKAALNAFTVHLAAELRDTKIKVNSAHPGWVKTEVLGKMPVFENAPEGNPPEVPGSVIAWLAFRPHFGATEDANARLPVFCTAPAILSPLDNLLAEAIATALALPLPASGAVGQQQSLREQLVGTWTVVSWEQKKSDGTKLELYGANPAGIAFFDAGGRYIITVMRSDRAKYASNTLRQGTAEEDKETADGTITYFGTYSLSETDRVMAIHVDGSSFPNWNGSDLKRIVAITGDQLTLTVPIPGGESVDVVWKRAK